MVQASPWILLFICPFFSFVMPQITRGELFRQISGGSFNACDSELNGCTPGGNEHFNLLHRTKINEMTLWHEAANLVNEPYGCHKMLATKM
ncbi:hypothetical protein BKA67DRAFT_574942 [Truncatella angustata]|uniref:Secreted protein n=1 Tax=Truncatella angustata TaxID=152316 RepID=A0A9P8UEL2_9PEZI|nr:uncharacterized protein BKA67DRAFT_574942 [Truncatella angustata]KAH6648484.1 hypothetical protein BKA67DRAFT_574942 [Truncatella angustata]